MQQQTEKGEMKMAMQVGTLTLNLNFKISLWQAIKLRIAGKGLAKRLVDEFVMARLKELREEPKPEKLSASTLEALAPRRNKQ
jgi:hypothetical protein